MTALTYVNRPRRLTDHGGGKRRAVIAERPGDISRLKAHDGFPHNLAVWMGLAFAFALSPLTGIRVRRLSGAVISRNWQHQHAHAFYRQYRARRAELSIPLI